jgi:deoxyribonuclease V
MKHKLDVDIPDMQAELRSLLEQIPRGMVTTYGTIATALGNVIAARWVGEYLVDHPHSKGCACHRVVRRDGEIGLYITGNPSDKQRLLERERVSVADGQVDLSRHLFNGFQGTRPLCRLADFQTALPQRVRLKRMRKIPNLVGGVDVSYAAPNEAVAAYALVDVATGSLQWSTTLQQRVTFPYIPGYLAFRELPLLLALLHKVDKSGRLADVLLVDGNGLLHPRKAGIATCLGVLAKSLLCGQVACRAGLPATEPCPVVRDGEILGMAVRASDRVRPVYVSPGQYTDVESSMRIVRRLFHGHRLPEPIFQADCLSRRSATCEKG